MTGRAVLGVVLVVAGALLDVPIALGLGLAVIGFEALHQVWVMRGLAGVGYRRHLAASRVPWGETTDLTIEVWNRSRLPLSWLRADDAVSSDLVVQDRTLLPGTLGDLTLRNTWTLGPRELVRRHLHVGAARRGVFQIGPAEVKVGDLFAMPAAGGEWPHVDRLVGWPRTVPAPSVIRRDRWGGLDRARTGLSEDPSRFVGLRPYQPGDPLRRLHVRASARLGHAMVKRFEPSRDRDVMLVLDLEPPTGLAGGGAAEEEAAESLIVMAASLVRSFGQQHAAFGLAAADYSGTASRLAFLPVSSSPGQMERGLDLLARLSTEASAPFERLTGLVGRAVRDGTTILVLTGREAGVVLRPLRALQRQGHSVRLLGAGEAGPAVALMARAAGIQSESVSMDGSWETATRLVISA